MNDYHCDLYIPILCPKVLRCFQINLNNSFPMFFVTFLVTFKPTLEADFPSSSSGPEM